MRRSTYVFSNPPPTATTPPPTSPLTLWSEFTKLNYNPQTRCAAKKHKTKKFLPKKQPVMVKMFCLEFWLATDSRIPPPPPPLSPLVVSVWRIAHTQTYAHARFVFTFFWRQQIRSQSPAAYSQWAAFCQSQLKISNFTPQSCPAPPLQLPIIFIDRKKMQYAFAVLEFEGQCSRCSFTQDAQSQIGSASTSLFVSFLLLCCLSACCLVVVIVICLFFFSARQPGAFSSPEAWLVYRQASSFISLFFRTSSACLSCHTNTEPSGPKSQPSNAWSEALNHQPSWDQCAKKQKKGISV